MTTRPLRWKCWACGATAWQRPKDGDHDVPWARRRCVTVGPLSYDRDGKPLR